MIAKTKMNAETKKNQQIHFGTEWNETHFKAETQNEIEIKNSSENTQNSNNNCGAAKPEYCTSVAAIPCYWRATEMHMITVWPS